MKHARILWMLAIISVLTLMLAGCNAPSDISSTTASTKSTTTTPSVPSSSVEIPLSTKNQSTKTTTVKTSASTVTSSSASTTTGKPLVTTKPSTTTVTTKAPVSSTSTTASSTVTTTSTTKGNGGNIWGDFTGDAGWDDITTVPTEPTSTPTLTDKPVTINGKKWLLTFEDNFDGNSVDYDKWRPVGFENRDTCMWGDENTTVVEDGTLKLKVIHNKTAAASGIPYRAGALRTRGTFEQAYGYYEIRCQLPQTSGICAAFWMMCDGQALAGNGARDGAEIDIFESSKFSQNIYQHAFHWDGYDASHDTIYKEIKKPAAYSGFHTFAMEWNKDEYIFYFDGEVTWRTNCGSGGVCEVPAYLKLTTATGGWVGNPNASKIPTDALIVDYVRAYIECP